MTFDLLGALVEEGARKGEVAAVTIPWEMKLPQDWRHGLGFLRIGDLGKTQEGWILAMEQPV